MPSKSGKQQGGGRQQQSNQGRREGGGGHGHGGGGGYRAQEVRHGAGFVGGVGRGGGYRGRAGHGRGVPPREFRQLNIVSYNENYSTFKGTSGRPTSVVANYFKMGYTEGMKVNAYRVDYFVLKEDGQRKEINARNRMNNRERFWMFVERFEQQFGGRHNLIYDDSHLLFTMQLLDFDGAQVKELTLEVPKITGKGTTPILIRIKQQSQSPRLNYSPEGFNVLNLILTQFARCPIEALNRNIHCEISRLFIKPSVAAGFHQPLDIYHHPLDLNCFKMLRGLYSFAKKGLLSTGGPGGGGGKGKKGKGQKQQTLGQAFANFDVTHSAFYKVALDILQFYAFVKTDRYMGEEEFRRLGDYGMNRLQRNELRTLLVGLRIKKKKIADNMIESEAAFCDVFDKTAQSYKFKCEEMGGKQVSIVEYFKFKYNYQIRFPIMPLIQIMPKEKNLYLPIEVARVSDTLQRLRRKLPDSLQALTNEFTTTSPKQRFSDIDHMVKEECKIETDPFLREFGVNIDPKFLQIGARVLDRPNCQFVNGRDSSFGPKENGKPTQIIFDLVIVNNCVDWNNKVKETSWDTLVKVCRDNGFNFLQDMPIGVTKFLFNAQQLDLMLKTRVDRYKQLEHKNVMPVIIIIVPPGHTEIYQAFKGVSELRFGIRSQVIQKAQFLGKRNDGMSPAVAKNIFFKINAKCGGVNIKIPRQGAEWSKFVGKENPTLFIGIDVTHPAPGDTISPSISALVGNIDVNATSYAAIIRAQHHRTEWIEDIKEMCKEQIKRFEEETKKLYNEKLSPTKIVVFRDGVSESQFEGVDEFEAKKMNEAIKEYYGAKHKPRLTFLVVQKRHSTRFCDAKTKDNLQQGTVVDGFITSHPKEYYLCSHQGMLGTSRPSHYYVLIDENNFTSDDLQICSNNLCNLYARCQKPVSIPAPVYYAHLACYRARHHWAAADDGLRVGQNGQSLEMANLPSGTCIMRPKEAVVVADRLLPTMYYC